MSAIPRILHQTWKDGNLPRDLKRFRKTWLDFHPDWEHRLWSDEDNRALLAEHYAWFLPVYDDYPRNIMRVDAVRYFILHRFGGVYADLDLECLRSITPLLEGKQLVVGCEPPQHLDQHDVAKRGDFGKILCNAFMASVPDDPFWEHVTRALPAYADATDPLSATGPFFLTRAYESYADKSAVSIESHEVLYPLGKEAVSARRKRELRERAYTVHHWRGSWWSGAYTPKAIARGVTNKFKNAFCAALGRARPWLRRARVLVRPDQAFRYLLYLSTSLSSRVSTATPLEGPGQMWVSRTSGGDCVARALVDLRSARVMIEKAGYPLVSCLMVTRERFALARRAVECFRKQTYPNKELIIVNDDPRDGLEQWVNSLRDPQIQYLALADEGKSLGELRKLSLQSARGEYVSQWDDDDLSHPERLMMQTSAMFAVRADAAFLHQQILWRPDRRRLGVSAHGLLENTMIARKDHVGEYRALKKGEDTPLCRDLIKETDVVLCDAPDLYVYVFHGGNAWDEEHFEKIWRDCRIQYKGSDYDRVLKGLREDLGIALDDPAPAFVERVEPAPPVPAVGTPKVLVLTPVKNGAEHLQRFMRNLDAATYPKDRLSLAFLESDSDDGSYAALEAALPRLREKYSNVQLFKRDFGYRASAPRWAIGEQFTRRSILARSRNLLLYSALRDEEWVLWMDVDLLRWPADSIERLLAAGEDVVVPHCIKPDGETFDLNTFVLSENAEELDWSRYVCDGILQPPVGYGRRYLGEFRHLERVEVDGVGGTMLLVRADLHRQGLTFPAYVYDYYIETEGLARTAKELGYKPCGLPNLTIVHK